jgi:hypothetical protein
MEPFRLTSTGKLITARVFDLKTLPHADEYARSLASEVARFPLTIRPVLCADHRPVAIYSQPVADRLSDLFAQMNSRLQRVAILVAPSNATLTLQLNRIVREARFENRRVFFESAEAISFLESALDAAERRRADQFLNELAAR